MPTTSDAATAQAVYKSSGHDSETRKVIRLLTTIASLLSRIKLISSPSSVIMTGKIDVHHHTLPEFYRTALSAAGDVSGAPVQPWSLEISSSSLMSKLSISTSILSLSAPGAEIAGSPAKGNAASGRTLAQKWSVHAASIRESQPDKFGFFGALPSLTDIEGAIEALKYALDVLKADGITLFTSYDGKYLGHEDFKPIWAELDKRNAVVFIHPCHTPSAVWASSQLAQPIIDYPHETTRAACDLIISGRKRQFPSCKIILSHAGGTLPFLAWRLHALCSVLFRGLLSQKSPRGEEIMDDAKSFYFDTALSGSANILDTLLRWAPKERVLYGSDSPYATAEAEWSDKELEGYEMDPETRRAIYRENSLKLFPRLARK